MNQFNFRIWDKKNKRFNYIGLVEQLRIAQHKDESFKFTDKDVSFSDNVIAQISSGKSDKNNKIIFQGDIIKVNNKSRYTKKEYWFPIYEVTWNGFSFNLKHLGGGKNNENMFCFENYPESCEVVGNIFESTIIIPKND